MNGCDDHGEGDGDGDEIEDEAEDADGDEVPFLFVLVFLFFLFFLAFFLSFFLALSLSPISLPCLLLDPYRSRGVSPTRSTECSAAAALGSNDPLTAPF